MILFIPLLDHVYFLAGRQAASKQAYCAYHGFFHINDFSRHGLGVSYFCCALPIFSL